MSEIADWVFEGVLQFLRSPLWTTPIHGFIEKHCHEFAADEEENKLVYTQLHNEFRTLVDELLSSFLSELGVEGEAFIDAIKSGENQELSSMVAEFLFALDDFPSFRALMEKKNLELELEAMYDYAKMSSQLTQEDVDDMTDEERFLFQMAVQLSLGDSDITMKRVEKEDAELLQALALSLAVEQERLVREQISEDANANANPAAAATGDAPPPPPARTVTSPGRTAEEIHEEVRQQRVANVERALFELQANQNGPQVTHASLAPIGPSQDAQRIVQKALAPIGEKRQQCSANATATLHLVHHRAAVVPRAKTTGGEPPWRCWGVKWKWGAVQGGDGAASSVLQEPARALDPTKGRLPCPRTRTVQT